MKKTITYILFLLPLLSGCKFYSVSMRGGDTSGSSTYSVEYFKPKTAQASQVYAQRFTDGLKDFIASASPLDITDSQADLQYSGSITGYTISPASVGQGEVAALNKLTITVKLKYVNNKEPDKSFDKSFSKFANYNSNSDIFAVEEQLWEDINEQLITAIYNASIGNW
ncbi:MAG TPA: hypothetical protein EYG86_01860 [Crocinitomicaceae bacterium]|nr:hypothetical protein [Crocinitomicaceae bacterium]